jgi:RimJ/RimL family protein N-acetyltransferase
MKIDWERIPTINAERISLRPLRNRDTDSIYAIYSDPEVMRYWGSTPMSHPAQAAQLLNEVQTDLKHRRSLQWGVARRSDDRIVGTLAFFHVDVIAKKAEIGFALGRAYWKNGYMLEALQAALRYAFAEMKLRRIEADVDPRNSSSIRVLERLGFQKEGYLRERWLVAEETQDALFYGLLNREWKNSGSFYEVHPPPNYPRHLGASIKTRFAHSRLRRWVALILGIMSNSL